MLTTARADDLSLPESVAYNHGRAHSRMRQWELPFVLFHARLPAVSSVLDCTINPEWFETALLDLYPHTLYRHWNPVQGHVFQLPIGVPDRGFDRVFCVNTLEHLLAPQRAELVREMARKLKPGGLLLITCDHYFDGFWQRDEILRSGVMRADRQEIFNGWNRVTAAEITALCADSDLHPLGAIEGGPDENDAGLYRNLEPYPHATIGAVFYKGPHAPPVPGKRIVLSLLTWNTRDISVESLWGYIREAKMLQRLGQHPFVVVCDNGSSDGTREALRALEPALDVPHQFIFNQHNRGSSIARNQVIDLFRALGGDYLLFMDGDIEIVPFSSFAMVRHMEDQGHLLGCLGADSYACTPRREQATPCLFSLHGCRLEDTDLVAWTQYGMFRREVFEDGVRFDEAEPFDRVGWGFEDNDLAFQMRVKGYVNQRFGGITYLHRYPNSSMNVMRSFGVNPSLNYARRKEYVVRKWQDTPLINRGPLELVRQVKIG